MKTRNAMKRMAWWRAVALATAVGVALTACAGTSAPSDKRAGDGKPVTGGNLVIATSGDPRSMDAVASPGPLTARFSELIFEGLFAPDKEFQARPMLVDDFTVSGDNLVYTFMLRDGVKFQDGSILSSADVVASLKRFIAVTATGRQMSRDVASVEAKDDLTVVMTLNKPRYPLLNELASTPAAIYKASVLEGLPETGLTQEQLIGTGPYKLKSWTPGQKIVLERFVDYSSRKEADWGGYAGAKNRYLDTLEFQIVSDPNAQVAGLTSGRWQYTEPNIDQYDILKRDPNLTVAPLAGANLNVLSTNQAEGQIFANPKAREALSLLIDREALDAAMGGNDEISVMTPSYVVKANQELYSTAGKKQYEAHDPERAKKLFAEAGVGPDSNLRILTISTYPWLQQMATLLQSQLKSIGIPSTIATFDWATATQMAAEKDGWDIETVFFNAASTTPGSLRILANVEGNSFTSDQLKSLMAAYSAAKSDTEAAKARDEMFGYLWSQYAHVTVNITHEYAAYTNKLKGFDNFYRVFWNSWLAK